LRIIRAGDTIDSNLDQVEWPAGEIVDNKARMALDLFIKDHTAVAGSLRVSSQAALIKGDEVFS
jgi:hypothetical protein